MTSKPLKRLRKAELLEMLLELSKENDKLRQDNQDLRQKLADRTIAVENSGSLAEAALQLNGIFEAAQAACQQYTQNIQTRSEDLERHCQQMEAETRAQCDAMLAQAQTEAQELLEEGRRLLEEEKSRYGWLEELMNDGESQ